MADPRASRPGMSPGRRLVRIALAVIAGVVLYAFAFDATAVNLDEIQNETRQESLARILRALARPELVTYDNETVTTEIPLAIPCGSDVPPPPAGYALSAPCGDPGDTITLQGGGLGAGENILVNFVPDAEFDITLPVARVQTDGEGSFTVGYELPDRPSEQLQAFQVVAAEPIGTWGNRQQVWSDANENGDRDVPRIGDDGTYSVELGFPAPEVAGAALVDSGRSLISFTSFGEPFEATGGIVTGQPAVPAAEGDVVVSAVESGGAGSVITLEGTPGTDLTGWRVAVYDATTGEQVGSNTVSDVIELSPRISQTTKDTWDKIIETVMLALVATTAGLVIAVPLSFLAARNIMRDISSTVTNLALALLAVPAGAAVGVLASRLVGDAADPVRGSLPLTALAALVAVGLAVVVIRWAVGAGTDDERPPPAARWVALVAAGLLGLFTALMLAELLDRTGSAVAPRLGPFGFIGGFLATLAELLDVLFPVGAALLGAGVLAHLASRLGYVIRGMVASSRRRAIDLALGAAAGALWLLLLAAVIDWFYRLDNRLVTVWVPALVGAVLGLVMAVRGHRRGGQVKIGLTIYYIGRTLFNTLRSIEPLVMVIVFVVWVGFGAFAGALALALHTAAALAKLYSEQVESISAGPMEAVRATGATRLQSIVYAVVPQIVPPYISFTMYRWDINVRMSTILGFAGGGGIGFLLQQNVALLQYRSAAVQMLAIVIVVASMDYLSARIRERII